MSKFTNAFEMTRQVGEIVKACEFIYGEKWPERKESTRKILTDHHLKNKTSNLLASAIQLCENQKDERVIILLIGASV